MTEEEQQTDPQVPAEPQEGDETNGRIVVVMQGESPIPIYVDFDNVSPFHFLAIGEWLSLKGRQMIAMAENAERAPCIATPDMSEEMLRRIVGVGKQ